MDLSGATDLHGVKGSASEVAARAGGEVMNRAGNLRGKRSYSAEFKEKRGLDGDPVTCRVGR